MECAAQFTPDLMGGDSILLDLATGSNGSTTA
jgi:hypothetical protein